MHEGQPAAALVSKRHGIGSREFGVRTKVGRKKNVFRSKAVIRPDPKVRPHCQPRAVGIWEYVLGRGAHQKTLQAAPAMGADHHEIDAVLVDPSREGAFNRTTGEQSWSLDFVVSRQFLQLLAAILRDL